MNCKTSFLFIFLIIGISCNAQEPSNHEYYSVEDWIGNNARWQSKLDSVAQLNNENCDSLQSIINDYEYKFDIINEIINGEYPYVSDTGIFSDTTVFIYDTLLFWEQYIGGVEFEQVGYYKKDSLQNVYFKIRNFDTVFHDSIYVDIWQGDSIRLRKEWAFEGLNPNESFNKSYVSKYATDTTDYRFILHKDSNPIDTAIVEWNSHVFRLHKVDSVSMVSRVD